MPFLHEDASVLYHQPMDSAELYWAETEVSGQGDRGLQPELGRLIIAVHVDVGRFVRFVAVEVYMRYGPAVSTVGTT